MKPFIVSINEDIMTNINMNSCTLHINASATASHPAERAVVHIRVLSTGENQGTVTADVLGSTAQLLSEVDKFRIFDANDKITPESPVTYVNASAVSNWSSMVAVEDSPNNDGLVTNERINNKPKRKIFSSQSNVEVRFRTFDLLSRITAVFSVVPHTEVRRIEWKVLEETERRLKTEARKDALRKAIEKANEYCEVASMHTCRPLVITDKGLSSTNGFRPQAPYTRSGDMELQPEHQRVTATIDVEFCAQY